MGLMLFLLLIFPFQIVRADNVERVRESILSVIDEELSELNRLSRQKNHSDPDIILRQADLHLEKGRLVRDYENKKFYALSEKSKQSVNRSTYFNDSSRHFAKANELCLLITRKYQSYSKISDVYYILGFNYKEANKFADAKKFLSQAAKTSRDQKTIMKSKISLAEIWYNEKQYKKAIPLYEEALSVYQDKWFTKDSYNLAWSYFRVNQHEKAIEKMLEVYKISTDPRYINIQDDVIRDLGLFYATSNKIDEGIAFYSKLGVDFSKQLLSIAKDLSEQGKFDQAMKVLKHAESYEQDVKEKQQIYLELLELTQKYGRYEIHLDRSKKLAATLNTNKLSDEDFERFVFQLEKVSATIQRQVVSKTYQQIPKQNEAKKKLTNEYFILLSEIQPKKSDEFYFLRAETSYAALNYNQAFVYYQNTLVLIEKKFPQSKFKEKSIEGMLSCLQFMKTKDNSKQVYAFEKYLQHYPNNEKAHKIYPRLFNNYKENKDYANAKKTLDQFNKYFPRDPGVEGMVAVLMDSDLKSKKSDSINQWVNDIENGKYFVSAKYKSALQSMLTKMQIDQVQDHLDKGNKKEALIGYHKIVADKNSTKRSRINAQYNLAVLYYELSEPDKNYFWAKNALEEMESKDIQKFSSSFLSMINYQFLGQNFKNAADLASRIFSSLCKSKDSKKQTLFKNAAFIYLAEARLEEVEALLQKSRQCGISEDVVDEIKYELLREYFLEKKYAEYEKHVLSLANSPTQYYRTLDEILNLLQIYKKYQDDDRMDMLHQKFIQMFNNAKKENKSITERSMRYMADGELKKMDREIENLNSIKFQFPEAVFAKLQKEKLDTLSRVTDLAAQVQQIGSQEGIMLALTNLSKVYDVVATEIFNFTPSDKSPEYIKAFKQDFNQVGVKLQQAAQKYRSEAKKIAENASILSEYNRHFQDILPPVEYKAPLKAYLMDRGGQL